MSTFALEPQQTREVLYKDFQDPGREVDTDALRTAARENIALDCGEPSGRWHYYQFR